MTIDHKTRRDFLFGLLGGLAGATGLSAIVSRSKTAAEVPGEPRSPGGKKSGPIDNIFVPLPPRKDIKRRGP